MTDLVAIMPKKPNGKRLNESQRCEIIAKLSKTDAPSKRVIAREYDVSEGAIRKVWSKREKILERSALMSDEVKEKTFRSSVGRFTELEDMLYIWIESMRRANLPVAPSLAISKAKSIASSLSIPERDFKASWQWLSRFKIRRGLQNMLLHKERAQVNFKRVEDDIIISQASSSGLRNTVEFKGFESLYKEVLDIGDQLLCSEVREEAGEAYDDLIKSYESFQSKLLAVTLKAKCKKL